MFAQRAHAWLLCSGLVGGLILSLIWMIILRFSSGLLAWFVILAVNLAFAACTLLAFTKVDASPPCAQFIRA